MSAQRALLRTAQEVAKGLAYVHSLGVVHADLKPANVLLQTHRGLDRRGYTARLADFGARVSLTDISPKTQLLGVPIRSSLVHQSRL